MYNSGEEILQKRNSMSNIDYDKYADFRGKEKEYNNHNISEAVRLMTFDKPLLTKDFNKYKRFVKSLTENMTTSWGSKIKPLAWKKEYDYKSKEKDKK